MGKGSGNGEGRSDTWQTHALASRTKEDRRRTEGSMGTGESWKEDGIAGFDSWATV